MEVIMFYVNYLNGTKSRDFDSYDEVLEHGNKTGIQGKDFEVAIKINL
jgi:hypothetical protein